MFLYKTQSSANRQTEKNSECDQEIPQSQTAGSILSGKSFMKSGGSDFSLYDGSDLRKRELVALLNLSSWCLVVVEQLFLAVPRGCLRFVIVVFPDHTHYF